MSAIRRFRGLFSSGAQANVLAVAHYTSPYITAYEFSATGFGTKYTNPATLPAGGCNDVSFTAGKDAIAVANASVAPFVSAYPWSPAGFGTRYTDPATLPTGACYGIDFSPAGNAIAVASNTTPYIFAY